MQMTYKEVRTQLIEKIREGILNRTLIVPITPGLPGRFMTYTDLLTSRVFIIHEEEVINVF